MTDERPVTYGEALRIGWLIAWRFFAVLLALGVVFGFFVGVAGAVAGLGRRAAAAIGAAGSLPLTIFVGYPLVVRMMLRKRFSGFRVRVARDEAPSTGAPREPFAGGF